MITKKEQKARNDYLLETETAVFIASSLDINALEPHTFVRGVVAGTFVLSIGGILERLANKGRIRN
jgi:hypothetical protein